MTRFPAFVRSGFVLPMAWTSPQVRRISRSAFCLLLGAVLLVSLTLSSTSAFAQFVGPTPLTLVNGWTGAPFSTSLPSVEEVNGIVQLRGAIANGTSSVAFTLPAGLSPAATVYVPVDMCNATNGRLIIQTNGVVIVQAESLFSNAQCFTSLDGASFAAASTGFTALTLINGWANYGGGTSNAAVQKVNGIVRFKGAIATGGTNSTAFTLPAAFRPPTNVYVSVDLCNATKGRLFITHAGAVTVQAETTFTNAQCFTSLDGAWFVAQPTGFKPLTLINGWTNAPFGTSNAVAGGQYGAVYFKGAIATAGTVTQPFTLPVQFRPLTDVYVPIDLCNATKGRLLIRNTGVVIVQTEGAFSNAQCFTSLDGASFVQ
jgi:hypothetical protein